MVLAAAAIEGRRRRRRRRGKRMSAPDTDEEENYRGGGKEDPLRPPSHSLPPERMHHPGGGGGGDGLGEAPGEDTTTDPLQQHHHRSRRRTERRSPFWHRPSNALSRPRWRTLAIAVALSLLVFAVGDSLQDAAVASPSSSTRLTVVNEWRPVQIRPSPDTPSQTPVNTSSGEGKKDTESGAKGEKSAQESEDDNDESVDETEQAVIDICRYSPSALCQVYFDLYNQLEKLPDSLDGLGLAETRADFGNKVDKEDDDDEEKEEESHEEKRVLLPSSETDQISSAGRRSDEVRDEEEGESGGDTSGSGSEAPPQAGIRNWSIRDAIGANEVTADQVTGDEQEGEDQDPGGGQSSGSKISVVRVLPPEGFFGDANPPGSELRRAERKSSLWDDLVEEEEDETPVQRRTGVVGWAATNSAVPPPRSPHGDMRDKVNEVLRAEERSRRQLAKQFAPKIFSSLIEASLPPPLAGEEVPSSSALPSPRRIRTQTYQSSPPSSDQPAQRRQFFGAAPVAPFSPFLPPPPPPVPVQKVLSRDSPYLGVPGVDFPAYDSIPATAFSCPGLPDGYYADPEAGCQVYHYCHYDGRQDTFLCPKGTVFNQDVLVCDWWYNSGCGGYGSGSGGFGFKRRTGGGGPEDRPPLAPPPSAPVSSAVLSSFARPATPAAGNDLFDFGEFVGGFEDGVGLARPKKAAAAAAAALSPPQPVASLAPPLSHRPSSFSEPLFPPPKPAVPFSSSTAAFIPRQITTLDSPVISDAEALRFHSDVEQKLKGVRDLLDANKERVRQQLESGLLADVDVNSVDDDYYYYDEDDDADAPSGTGLEDYYSGDYEEDLLRPPVEGGGLLARRIDVVGRKEEEGIKVTLPSVKGEKKRTAWYEEQQQQRPKEEKKPGFTLTPPFPGIAAAGRTEASRPKKPRPPFPAPSSPSSSTEGGSATSGDFEEEEEVVEEEEEVGAGFDTLLGLAVKRLRAEKNGGGGGGGGKDKRKLGSFSSLLLSKIVGQRRQDSRVHENGSVSSSLLPGLAELLATTQALREGSLTSADKRLMVALAQKVLTEEMGEAAPEEEEEEEEEGLTGFLDPELIMPILEQAAINLRDNGPLEDEEEEEEMVEAVEAMSPSQLKTALVTAGILMEEARVQAEEQQEQQRRQQQEQQLQQLEEQQLQQLRQQLQLQLDTARRRASQSQNLLNAVDNSGFSRPQRIMNPPPPPAPPSPTQSSPPETNTISQRTLLQQAQLGRPQHQQVIRQPITTPPRTPPSKQAHHHHQHQQRDKQGFHQRLPPPPPPQSLPHHYRPPSVGAGGGGGGNLVPISRPPPPSYSYRPSSQQRPPPQQQSSPPSGGNGARLHSSSVVVVGTPLARRRPFSSSPRQHQTNRATGSGTRTEMHLGGASHNENDDDGGIRPGPPIPNSLPSATQHRGDLPLLNHRSPSSSPPFTPPSRAKDGWASSSLPSPPSISPSPSRSKIPLPTNTHRERTDPRLRPPPAKATAGPQIPQRNIPQPGRTWVPSRLEHQPAPRPLNGGRPYLRVVGSNCYLFDSVKGPTSSSSGSSSFGPELVGPAAACEHVRPVAAGPPAAAAAPPQPGRPTLPQRRRSGGPGPYTGGNRRSDFGEEEEGGEVVNDVAVSLGLMGQTSASLWRTIKSLPDVVGHLVMG